MVGDTKEKTGGRVKVTALLLAISKKKGPGTGGEQKGSRGKFIPFARAKV